MRLERIMLGSESPEQDVYTAEAFSSNAVIGISAGSSRNAKEKEKPNEDSAGIATLANGYELYMVADANGGHLASELAVKEFPAILERHLAETDDIQRALYKSVMELDDRVRDLKPMVKSKYFDVMVPEGSATTFIAALKVGNEVYYVSVGDSFIYLFDNETVVDENTEPVNRRQHPTRTEGWIGNSKCRPLINIIENYLSLQGDPLHEEIHGRDGLCEQDPNYPTKYDEEGRIKMGLSNEECQTRDRIEKDYLKKSCVGHEYEGGIEYDRIAGVVSIGKLELTKRSTLLLATDGIEEHASGISIEEVKRFVTEDDSKAGISVLFEQILRKSGTVQYEHGKYVKGDNVTLIAIRG